MKKRCLSAEEIASLQTDDRRMEHVEDCPRCSTLLASFRDFEQGGTQPPPEKAQAFRARFAEALAAEEHSSRPPFWSFFARPVWAAAVVVLVCLVAWRLWDRPGPMPGERILRGEANTPAVIATAPPRWIEGGELHLSWAAHPEAEGYAIDFLLPSGIEVARRETNGLSYAIPTDSLRSMTAAGSELIWRVSVLRGGDEIARSQPRALVPIDEQ